MNTPFAPKIWRFDNANSIYYALIDALASSVEKLIAQGKKPVLALPTGNTMIPFYRLVAENEERLHTDSWTCFNLDEYYPVDDFNESLTFDAYMETHLYSRLKKPVQMRKILNGRTHSPEQECADYESLIQALGGIDITLLGLGLNGHIAFNEPKSSFDSRTRLLELHPETLMANFKGQAIFSHAMTMGIGTILESREIMIVALGKNKAPAIRSATQEGMSTACPASALQMHPRVTWFVDQEAGSLI